MDSDQSRFQPAAISRVLLDRAKFFWGAALGCKFVITIMGTVSVLRGVMIETTPFVLLVLATASEYFVWRSDAVKGVAEALRRKTDAQDTFGWSISNEEISDLLVQNHRLQDVFRARGTQEPYFASKEPTGAKRALENLQESAWWSKHLSRMMGNYCAGMGACLLLVPIGLLLYSLEVATDIHVLAAIGKVASSLFTLGLSLGLGRMAASYYSFSSKADRVEKSAVQELRAGNNDEIQAIKLMHEYHLARANAPLIPTWLWKWYRPNLNQVWTEYRHGSISED